MTKGKHKTLSERRKEVSEELSNFDALLLLKLLASATNSLSELHVIEAASVSIPPV